MLFFKTRRWHFVTKIIIFSDIILAVQWTNEHIMRVLLACLLFCARRVALQYWEFINLYNIIQFWLTFFSKFLKDKGKIEIIYVLGSLAYR